ncbi:hypothetical protein PUR61_27075 [Streptomyces sp. BE20]|uniref:hypothetical protein n=1 Tax=Streptomycetaceae TaxID=2062 RepID=UPI002E770114|nr:MULTISPECIES: hypothetical protein [unclassified Streptomyces]MED7950261.1 hypothetical protein [Streptomyces sp. BE303]MEE1825823.1 hypothetical protein [Streptomyces sp. BE20]
MRGFFKAAPGSPILVTAVEYWVSALLGGFGADAAHGGRDVGRRTGSESGGAEACVEPCAGDQGDWDGDAFPLVGRACVILPGGATATSGWAETSTDDGAPALLPVRTAPGDPVLPAGRTALLHSHDTATGVFLVSPLDLTALFS